MTSTPLSKKRLEIVVSGSGGQGSILAGRLLAETAAVYGGMQTALVPCFGPEVRGGFSSAELIIDSNQIDYPRITSPDILIALSRDAMNKYGPAMGSNGLVLVNETFVQNISGRFKNVFSAPFTAIAIKKLKTPLVANMIALGALAAVSGIISPEYLKLTIEKHVPEKVLKIDKMAVETGFEIAVSAGLAWQEKVFKQ